MKIYLIGTGMDGCKTLTKEARDAIADSSLLIGAERMLKPFTETDKKTICAYMPQDIADALNNGSNDTAAVLLSGDIGFFSGAKNLFPLLHTHEVKPVCGISSAAYLCALAGISYENMKMISLHGRHSNIAVNVRMNEKCFFLLGGDTDASAVCRRLCDNRLNGVTVYIGENLGYDNEKIYTGTAEDFTCARTSNLCALITVNNNHLKYIPSAIEDGEFIRADIPMTKSAVRGNIGGGMNIGSDSICWDIGCGTGSVSVEMAFRCPDGKVFAFDKKSEAVGLTMKNAARFCCDNISAAVGLCPDILENAPAPNKVFIGGSSGNLTGIIECARGKNPCADITISAVSIETLEQARKALGDKCSITQIAVTETKKIGGHTMLAAQNPVFIIKEQK